MDKELTKFLDKADDAFIYAYETRRYGVLTDMFTIQCMRNISVMASIDNGTRYFGKKGMRNTTWEIISENEDEYEVRKTVIYRKIHLTMTRLMKASTDYTCIWKVIKLLSGGYKVISIGKEDYLYDLE